MLRGVRWAGLALLLPVLGAADPARAQPGGAPSPEVEASPAPTDEADREAAAAAFERGERLYAEGAYEEAIESFRRAYALAPDPAPLFNIARSYENLGETAFAIQFFEQYVLEAPAATDRSDVVRRLARLRSRPVRLFVSSSPSGATVTADGSRAEQATPAVLRLAPGPHVLLVRAAGYVSRTVRMRLLSARDATTHVVLEASEGSGSAQEDEGTAGRDEMAELAAGLGGSGASRARADDLDSESDLGSQRIAARRERDGAFDLVLGASAGTTRLGAGDLQLDVGVQVGLAWRFLLALASLGRIVLDEARTVALVELGYAARVDALDLVGFVGAGITDGAPGHDALDALGSFGVRAELYVERWWTVGACVRFAVRNPFADELQVWSTFDVLTAVRL